jgi:nucleoside-diphosphate-sugar epimerase
MKVLILGASGATGKLVVKNLLKKEIQDRIVTREVAIIPGDITEDQNIEIIKGNINDFDILKIKELVKDCDSVICCLGHNMSFKGILGPPHKLVYNTVEKVIKVFQSLNLKKKFILMSTTEYTNEKIGEKNSLGEKVIFSLLKIFLPPHNDNMAAADYLVHKFALKDDIDWVAVRPDTLIDELNESTYEVFSQRKSSPIFNPGKTSRINVSHFMVELITQGKLWDEWNHKTPVIYNKV